MSLYADYLKEREGVDTVELSIGFATYRITEDRCYIIDIYVEPESRQVKAASMIADRIVEIAKERNCKYLTGSVCPTTNGATTSLKVLLAYGFQLGALDHAKNLIYFYKDI